MARNPDGVGKARLRESMLTIVSAKAAMGPGTQLTVSTDRTAGSGTVSG